MPAAAVGDELDHSARAADDSKCSANVTRSDGDERYGKLTDLSAFQREILPLIQEVPLSRLARATGLSLRYVSLVRRGEKTPHPRHWQNLAAASEGTR